LLVGCTDDHPTALPAGVPAAGLVAAANEVWLPFHGTVATTHTNVYDTETNTAHSHLVGEGTATHLGRYTLVSDGVVGGATLAGTESTTLTAANGDILFATGTVQGTPSEDGLSPAQWSP
jgi:hypothetical protein